MIPAKAALPKASQPGACSMTSRPTIPAIRALPIPIRSQIMRMAGPLRRTISALTSSSQIKLVKAFVLAPKTSFRSVSVSLGPRSRISLKTSASSAASGAFMGALESISMRWAASAPDLNLMKPF
jgi:hypothetical protein